MLKATNLSFSYGSKPLFEQVTFTITKTMKVGLVGPNGTGKSSLLKLIIQEEQPDEGSLELLGTVALVPQEVKHDPLLDNASSIREYLDPTAEHKDWELEDMMRGLEFSNLNLSQKPLKLSGGQKTKLAIIRALLLKPDLLLLDEPTNFLDDSGKRWVMSFLSTYPKALILISHDLKLMDHAIEKVLAINSQFSRIDEYTGNYSDYVQAKKQRDQMLRNQVMNAQKKIKRMQESLLRMQRFTSEKGVRQRTILKRRVEKMQAQLPELPKELRKIKIHLPTPSRVGEVPVIIRNVSKAFGSVHVLKNLSLSIRRQERVVLIGPNGAGKSTLIKTIMGLITPDKGQIELDDKLTIGYYSQEFETFNFEKTLYDTIGDIATYDERIIRPFLAKFMFAGDKVYQKIGTLSGGEKTRLSIALLLLNNFNLLILDEPTTYLDVLSQRVILEALKLYQGSMLVVSHTKEFITQLKPDKAIFLPQQKIKLWEDEFGDRVEVI